MEEVEAVHGTHSKAFVLNATAVELEARTRVKALMPRILCCFSIHSQMKHY